MTDNNGIGHNGPDGEQDEFALTPREQEALFFSHLNPLLRQKAKCDEERAKYNKLRKQAKAEGFKLRIMDEAVRIHEAEDDEIIAQEIKDRVQMAAWMGLPVGSQLGMFDTDHLAPLVDRARSEGKVAGALGKEPRSAYDESTEAGQAWLEGWNDGQAGMRDDLKSGMDKRNAAAKAEKDAKAKAKERKKSRAGEAAAAESADLNPVGQDDAAAADIPAFLDKNKGEGGEDAAAE
jgi:ribosome modulation factor